MTIRPIGAHFRALRRTALVAALALSSVVAAARGGSPATAYSTGCHSPLFWLNLGSPARTVEITLEAAPEKHLPDDLPVLPDPSWLRWLGKNGPVSRWVNRQLHKERSEPFVVRDLSRVLVPNQSYTFVIRDGKLILLPTNRTFSKHVFLAAFGPVKFAGELRLDAEGVLHVSNASGTYRTPASLLQGMGRVLEENFRPAGIVLHEHGEGA
jgi:hypothetical protein